ncbi:MAG: hypothetical protein OSB57_11415 [Planctomycetota bacterium]|nr:hypothetical protein [Planctomycetota bacterium]
MSATREFFEALFPEETVNAYNRCVLWAPDSTANDWCISLDELVDKALKRSERGNVYFGASLQSPGAMTKEAKHRKVAPDPKFRRGYVESASVLPGVWLDLDYGDDGHEKINLPPTEEAAMELVAAMPAEPNIIIHTGGGLHVWWLLLDPFEITDDETWARAQHLSHGWGTLARLESEKRGWSMDAVHDLARVMRIPGTKNHKEAYGEHGREVKTLLYSPEARHDIDGLEVFLPEVRIPPSSRRGTDLTEFAFDMDPGIQPDERMLTAAKKLDPKFAKVWDRLTTLASQSEYDLSIGNTLADLGWNDQLIVNALIYHRAGGSSAPKLRHKYYAGTLKLIRETFPDISESTERMATVSSDIATGLPVTPTVRKQVRDDLSTMLGMPPGCEIERIEKYEGDPPTYALRTPNGTISLGQVSGITRGHLFRDTVAAATNHLIDSKKAAVWAGLAQAILHAAEPVDLGEEVTMDGEVLGWLDGYLGDEGLAKDVTEGCEARMPFWRRGEACFFLEGLRAWLRTSRDLRMESRSLARRLRSSGVRRGKATIDAPSGRTSRGFWVVPGRTQAGQPAKEG